MKAQDAGRQKRHERIRRVVRGTAARPRLVVFRSLRHIYAQVVDDERGVTLVAAGSQSPELKGALCPVCKKGRLVVIEDLVPDPRILAFLAGTSPDTS